ncbi:MAG: hypothetical protein H7227_02415 [Actinobacteria bacterium]|nr:hypothetical protein [Actinomycetota bacterium]
MLTRRAALILRLHASFLFFLAIVLLIRPGTVLQFMGVESQSITPDLSWSLRFAGSLLLLPALLAPLTAAFAGERGLRQAGAGMAVISLCIGVVTALAPIGLTAGKILMALIWLVFAVLYLYALRGRGRNR